MKTGIKEFIELGVKDEVVDYNNPNCINCKDCCGNNTPVLLSEYNSLLKYFKTKEGKEIFKAARKIKLEADRKLIEDNIVDFSCPFNSKNCRCKIYYHRPSVCKDFHCSKDLLKKDYNKDNYNVDHITINDLFEKKEYVEKKRKEREYYY